MRIATFNAENLFSRPAAMNHLDNAVGQPVVDDFHRLNGLLKEPVFTPAIKQQIEALVDKYKLTDRTVEHDQLILRQIRGQLWQQHLDGTRTWEATGAGDFRSIKWQPFDTVVDARSQASDHHCFWVDIDL